MHAGFRGHTIDDVKRVVVIQCSHTTDANRSSAARVTVGLDIHARHTSLQGLHRVVFVLLGYIVYAHRRNGTSQVGLALAGVTRHHHFLQQFCVIFHRYLHTLLCKHFYCLVANVRDDEGGILVHFDFEVAIEVCHRSVRRTLLLHRGADNHFTEVIDHRSRYLRLSAHYGA